MATLSSSASDEEGGLFGSLFSPTYSLVSFPVFEDEDTAALSKTYETPHSGTHVVRSLLQLLYATHTHSLSLAARVAISQRICLPPPLTSRQRSSGM
jgi:hypothetical protein